MRDIIATVRRSSNCAVMFWIPARAVLIMIVSTKVTEQITLNSMSTDSYQLKDNTHL